MAAATIIGYPPPPGHLPFSPVADAKHCRPCLLRLNRNRLPRPGAQEARARECRQALRGAGATTKTREPWAMSHLTQCYTLPIVRLAMDQQPAPAATVAPPMRRWRIDLGSPAPATSVAPPLLWSRSRSRVGSPMRHGSFTSTASEAAQEADGSDLGKRVAATIRAT